MATRTAQRLLACLFTLPLLAGCSNEEAPSAAKASALTPAEQRTIKFELLSDWHRFSGTGTLASSTHHSEGEKSLALSGMGYIAARNLTPLTKDEQQTPQVVGYDIWVPAQQPNPAWHGDTQLVIDAPSAGVYQQYLGYRSLQDLPKGQWVRVEFPVPNAVRQALNAANYTDLRFIIAVNVPAGSQAHYLDNFTLGPVPTSCTPVSDDNVCTADTCDPATGQTTHTPVAPGTACSDGNACNGAETCGATGSCEAGTAPPVDDGNPCTVDACSPSGGVTHTPVSAGTSCSDGDACNGTEACDGSGTCTAGTAPVVDDGNPCTADACDSELGVMHTPVSAGTSCSDGDACNGAEACDGAGTCATGTPLSQDDGNPCTADACDPELGVTHTPVSAGTSCSDGNACNGAEACDASGACVAGTPPAIDDGNVCTADACDPELGVTHTPVSGGISCSDGNACNGAEACDGAGSCMAGTPPVVDDGNVCTVDACDPATGVTHTPASAGTSCSDGNACNGAEACNAAGSCAAGAPPVVDDENPCTADACDPELGVTHTPVSAGVSCSDGNACNGAEACDGSGTCVAGTPPTIDDGNVCTADACDPEVGVTHAPVSAGTSCSDGNLCNGAEACDGAGSCAAGTPLVVDDGNPCTADSCDPVVGVSHVALSAGVSCGDGNACNGEETCDGGGLCESGTPIAVDDQNPCTVDSCDPAIGVVHSPVSAGVSCADGNFCNGEERCDGTGACVVDAPPNIDDGNACTVDTCDPVQGVVHVVAAAGTACEDGNLCNGTETCNAAGVCTAGTPLTAPAEENPCITDVTCDVELGLTWDFEPAGSACAIGFICDGSGQCLRDQGGGTLPPPPPSGAVRDFGEYARGLPREPAAGCALATLNPDRVAIVTGKVLTRDPATGQHVPVVGAEVTVPLKCAAGLVRTLEDGAFFFPMEGGSRRTLRVQADADGNGTFDYLPAERSTYTAWGATAGVDPIELILPAPVAGTLDLDGGMVLDSVILSGPTTTDDRDGDGIAAPRTPSLLLKEGTTISGVDENGGPVTLDAAVLRITEYTVGPSGLSRMPAAVPPGTAYGYAMELSLDGAHHTTFDQPAVFYVDNFLGAEAKRGTEGDLPFEVGLPVPTWYYNGNTGAWEREEDGIILRLVGVDDSAQALIDADGDGDADFDDEDYLLGLGFEIDQDEREQLAAEIDSGRRAVGDELWRVEVEHLSPRDLNWLRRCGEECGVGSILPDGEIGGPDGKQHCFRGSQINVESMSLSERFPIAGTPFSLNYNSRTVYGYEARRQLRIDRTPPDIPFIFRGMTEQLSIGGKTMHPEGCEMPIWGFCRAFDGYSTGIGWILWDGRDADGRIAYGTHRGLWHSISVWGPDLAQVYIPKSVPVQMTVYDAKLHGLGGWTLSPHHYYDVDAPVLFLGDGTETSSSDRVVERIANFGVSFQSSTVVVDLQVVEDGTLFFGRATPGQTWGPATQYNPSTGATTSWGGTAIRADGPDRVYGSRGNTYAYANTSALGRSDRINGVIQAGPSIDNHATPVAAMKVGPDRLLYTVRRSNPMTVHRYSEDLVHVDGGVPYAVFPGAPPGRASEFWWSALDFLGDTLYLAISGNSSIFRMDPGDTEPTLVANLGGDLIEGQPVSLSTTWTMGHFRSLRVTEDGIFFSRVGSNVLWRIDHDGILRRVVGNPNTAVNIGEGGSALNFGLGPDFTFDIAPDGSIYIVTNSANPATDPQGARFMYRVPPPGSRDYVVNAGYQVPSEDGTELYDFAQDGRHLRTRSVLTGRVVRSFEYDNGLLSAIIEGDSEIATGLPTTRILRGTDGLVQIQAPSGQTTSLHIDEDTGYLRRLVDPTGSEVRLTHDTGGLLREMRDERGFVHTYGYDEFGRLMSDSSPGTNPQTLVGWHLLDVTHTNGASEESNFDISVNRGAGAQTRTATRPDGSWATLTRDADLNRTLTSSDGTIVTDTFVPHPTLGVGVPIVNSRTTVLPSGLARAEEYALSFASGVWTATHMVNGAANAAITDQATRTITSTSPEGRTSTVILDEQNRPSVLVRGDLEFVSLAYDGQGRLVSVESGDGPDSRMTTFEYFADGTGQPNAGYLKSITNAEDQEVTFTRDAFGRALSATSGSENTFFDYSERGHLERLTTPRDDTHIQEWNGVNLLTEYVAPSISGVDDLLENTYDDARRLRRTTLPGGVRLDVTRDGVDPGHPERHGRLRSIGSSNSGNGTSPFLVDFVYADELSSAGPPGQLAQLTRGAIETQLAWDGALPLGEASRVNGAVGMRDSDYSLTWNADFLPSGETVSIGTSSLSAGFAYDQDGVLVCASASGSCDASRGVTYQFDSGANDTAADGHGLLESATSGLVHEEWSHNTFGEVIGRVVSVDGSEVLSITYERDLLGRITSQTVNRGAESITTSYTYDAQGQLVSVSTDDPNPLAEPVRAYKYDANGNRLCVTESPEMECAEEAEYDAQDRLREMDGIAYSYTDRGTLYRRVDGTRMETFTYDALGNLTRVERNGGPPIDYLVDAQSRRVGKRVDGALTKQYVWSGGLRVAAELQDGEVVSRFIYGNGLTTPDLVLRKGATAASDRLYRVVSDHLGSPLYVVNIADADDVWLDASYDEWGNVTSFKLDGVDQGDDTSAWPIPQGFAGGLFDTDTGLVRFGARDYDPRTGRWTAKDPILFEGGQGNLFVYVGNDPVGRIDPRGLYTEVIFWEPVGFGSSSFGHVSVDVNGRTYSWGPGGMHVGSTSVYLRTNTRFRSGRGLILGLSFAQEAALEASLAGHAGPYSAFSNNCGDPLECALRDLGLDVGDELLPMDTFRNILDYAIGQTYHAGPQRMFHAPWSGPSVCAFEDG